MSKVTTATLAEMKRKGERITALTAYDAPTARLLDEAGVDVVLVGDSVGNVKLGYDNTLPVTVDQMLHHVQAVRRGLRRAMLVADLPFLSYELAPGEAARNAGRLIKEGGAEAVKLEGGIEMAPAVKELLRINVPVMGHLGLTPQSVHRLGGYKVQGRRPADAEKIVTDARILEGAGAFAVVLEAVPEDVGREVTRKLSIPTIGIGAGASCDGQILVVDDLLGLGEGPAPKFVKRYADLRPVMLDAVKKWSADVRSNAFPGSAQTYGSTPAPTREKRPS